MENENLNENLFQIIYVNKEDDNTLVKALGISEERCKILQEITENVFFNSGHTNVISISLEITKHCQNINELFLVAYGIAVLTEDAIKKSKILDFLKGLSDNEKKDE